MADVNIGLQATPVAPVPAAQAAPAQNTQRIEPVTPERDQNADAASAAERIQTPAPRELDNVVSVSKDGDTVQASPAGVERLSDDSSVRVIGEQNAVQTIRPEADFRTEENENQETALDRLQEDAARRAEVIKAGQESAERRAEALKEVAEDQSTASLSATRERVSATPDQASEPVRVDVGDNAPGRQVTSYAGISNQQLEQMYLQGTISKYDYDSEIASREERTEQAKADSQEFYQEGAAVAGIANQSMQNFNAIDEAYTREQTIDEARQATERVEAMTSVQKVLDGTP